MSRGNPRVSRIKVKSADPQRLVLSVRHCFTSRRWYGRRGGGGDPASALECPLGSSEGCWSSPTAEHNDLAFLWRITMRAPSRNASGSAPQGCRAKSKRFIERDPLRSKRVPHCVDRLPAILEDEGIREIGVDADCKCDQPCQLPPLQRSEIIPSVDLPANEPLAGSAQVNVSVAAQNQACDSTPTLPRGVPRLVFT